MVKVLLVIECQSSLNWYDVFQGVTFQGEPIQVEQAEWPDISLTTYHDSGAVVTIRRANKPIAGSSQERTRTVQVDFVLLRSVTHGIVGQDSRNLLFGLIHANLPSVNTLQSAVVCLERPLVFGALKGIQKKLGKNNFPLIPQTYYPSHKEMLITPDFPIVAKVGHAHAGYGKMKFNDSAEFSDFRSLCALHNDYVTCEPFIDWDFDMRIQKIGTNYRAFRRQSPNWKGNVGNASVLEDMDMTPQYKLWVDECAKLFGGLDILGLDLVHARDGGHEFILELNDTAIGLVHKYEIEDMHQMKDLVLVRMQQHFGVAVPLPLPANPHAADADAAGPSDAAPAAAEPVLVQSPEDTISQLQAQLAVMQVQLEQRDRTIDGLRTQLQQAEQKKKKDSGRILGPFLNFEWKSESDSKQKK